MSQKSAQILKDFLQHNCLTQTEFARVTCLSRLSIYKYLRGANIHPKAAKKIEQKVLEEYRVFFPHEKLID